MTTTTSSNVETIRTELAEQFPTLHLVGRNGMHKYNNQDHAMMTAMLTVKNIAAGSNVYDIWNVNEDAEYHEAGNSGEAGSAEERASRSATRRGRCVIENLAEMVRRHAGLIAEASGYLAVSVVALGVDFAVYWLLLGLFAKAFVPAIVGYAIGLVVALPARLAAGVRGAAQGSWHRGGDADVCEVRRHGSRWPRDDGRNRRSCDGYSGLERVRRQGAGDRICIRRRLPDAALCGVRGAREAGGGLIVPKCLCPRTSGPTSGRAVKIRGLCMSRQWGRSRLSACASAGNAS